MPKRKSRLPLNAAFPFGALATREDFRGALEHLRSRRPGQLVTVTRLDPAANKAVFMSRTREELLARLQKMMEERFPKKRQKGKSCGQKPFRNEQTPH